MKTVLLSTSSLWNCGDDFIRAGLLRLLRLRPDVRTLWWNRAWGVTDRYANDLDVNLPLVDYVIMAGTPEWVDRNERIYEHCLANEIPLALIGVGLRGCVRNRYQRDLLRRVIAAGIVEVALARDRTALEFLREAGLSSATMMIDPAFFLEPAGDGGETNVLCWRDLHKPAPRFFARPRARLHWERRGRREREEMVAGYNETMRRLFAAMPEPKMIVVHDNREVAPAEELFAEADVFYATDPTEILRVYAGAASYVGSRIHGAIPAMLHGAPAHLIYANNKAGVIEESLALLAEAGFRAEGSVRVSFLDSGPVPESGGMAAVATDALHRAIALEATRVRRVVAGAAALGRFVESGGAP